MATIEGSRRQPSTSISIPERVFVRRRSRRVCTSTETPTKTVSKVPSDDPELSAEAEDTPQTAVRRQPGVSTSTYRTRTRIRVDDAENLNVREAYTNVPLTPAGGTALSQSQMEPEDIPQLPTPDYCSEPVVQGDQWMGFSGHVSETLSYFTARKPVDGHRIVPDAHDSSTNSKPQPSKAVTSMVDPPDLDIDNPPDLLPRRWSRPRGIRQLSSMSDIHTDSKSIRTDEKSAPAKLKVWMRWTTFKWALLVSITILFAYSTVILVYSILVWLRDIPHAQVFYVVDYDILVLATFTGCLLIFSALLGLTGTLFNSRPLLALYVLLLWSSFSALLAIMYTAYRRVTFAPLSTLDVAWTDYFNDHTRLTIQNALQCCGYNSPWHAVAPSAQCFDVQSPLAGCKGQLLRFQKTVLVDVWQAIFAFVPLHIAVLMTALLCANHVDRRFGEGITPKGYWPNTKDVRRSATIFHHKTERRPLTAEVVEQYLSSQNCKLG